MTSVFDVPTAELIEEIAKELEKNPDISKPAFAGFVKTGSHRERAPEREDWWYVRLASLLYRTYKNGPVGTGQLRTYYGGRKARGVQPHHFRKSGGKIIRLGLQTLEKAGFIQKAKKGRIISSKGEKFLAQKAKETLNGLEEKTRQRAILKLEAQKKRLERETKQKNAMMPLRPAKGKEKEKTVEKKPKP